MQHGKRMMRGAMALLLVTSGTAWAAEPERAAPEQDDVEHATSERSIEHAAPATGASAPTADDALHHRPAAPHEPTAAELTQELSALPGSMPAGETRLDTLGRERVDDLQRQLARLGFYRGSVDGRPGAGTRAALQRFFVAQAALAERGVLTPAMARSLGLAPFSSTASSSTASPSPAASTPGIPATRSSPPTAGIPATRSSPPSPPASASSPPPSPRAPASPPNATVRQ